MACVSQTLAGLVADCSNSKGGLKKVLISTTDPKPIIENGVITDWNVEQVEWYEYNFKKNTSSFTSTLNVDAANGINFVSTEITLQFNKMDTVKRIEMSALALNEMYVIILDSNNTYWYLGMDDACQATAGSSQTGQSKTDGNFYQIVITDESKTWPYEVKKEAIPPIIGSYNLKFIQNDGDTNITFESTIDLNNVDDPIYAIVGDPEHGGKDYEAVILENNKVVIQNVIPKDIQLQNTKVQIMMPEFNGVNVIYYERTFNFVVNQLGPTV